MVTVVDFRMGNIRSVINACEYLGMPARASGDPEVVANSGMLVLPGVGSFRAAMRNLKGLGLAEALAEAVQVRRRPLLGICLGMQLLAEEGTEDGLTPGLGWVPGRVERFRFEDPGVKVPHVGFNTVRVVRPGALFAGLPEQMDFYFVHSYRLVCREEETVTGWADYHGRFVASVQRGNIAGTQFHPEKSQSNGLLVLRNFFASGGPDA